MNVWTLVPGETDKADLSCSLGFQHSFHRSAFGEYAIWIGIANYLMELQQVDSIGLQPSQGVIHLGNRGGLVSAIDLGHQEGFLAITVAQCSAHSNFALS